MAQLKLVTVYESQGMLGAQVVKGKLESAGLPVLLKYESYGQVLGLTVDGLGLVGYRCQPSSRRTHWRCLTTKTKTKNYKASRLFVKVADCWYIYVLL